MLCYWKRNMWSAELFCTKSPPALLSCGCWIPPRQAVGDCVYSECQPGASEQMKQYSNP